VYYLLYEASILHSLFPFYLLSHVLNSRFLQVQFCRFFLVINFIIAFAPTVQSILASRPQEVSAEILSFIQSIFQVVNIKLKFGLQSFSLFFFSV
jgi:hypothetical protein